jgi:hypothetical protein
MFKVARCFFIFKQIKIKIKINALNSIIKNNKILKSALQKQNARSF